MFTRQRETRFRHLRSTLTVAALGVVACWPATAPAVAAPAQDADLYPGYEGPTSLMAGVSGTFRMVVYNRGYTAAPVELFIIFTGAIEQTGRVVAPGMDCEVRQDNGINGAVRCTAPTVGPINDDYVEVTVQGRGQSPGTGKIAFVVNPNQSAVESDYGNNTLTLKVEIQ